VRKANININTLAAKLTQNEIEKKEFRENDDIIKGSRVVSGGRDSYASGGGRGSELMIRDAIKNI